MSDFIILLPVFVLIMIIREFSIMNYKISYYETRLELQGVNIDKVKNIGFIGIIKS
jgi:hypothetical protein